MRHRIRAYFNFPISSAVFKKRTFLYRGICHPLVKRQPYYKYMIIVVIIAFSLEFPRFFEMKLSSDSSHYWTTPLMENPRYVQFSSYWNEITATCLVPLFLLCFINLRIFLKIQVKKFLISFQKIQTFHA